MSPELCEQELQLGVLKEQALRYLTTFRWLWALNLAAAAIGVVMHRYELTVVAAGSSLVALVGVALARRGRTTVSEITVECHRIQSKLDPE